jgi:two-component system phosphate regulon sensor histidine kinase PhoR
VTVTPIGGGAGGAPEAWLLSVEDLRPEKAMAALRREFVANASHELKTPLTSIHGYAETLLSGGLEDEANRARFVETIRTQAERLEALVEDLLELADLERPDAALDIKDWDLAQIVREMTATFEELAERRGLQIECDVRPGIRARVDRAKIDLALRNLLDNAIKYTDGGTVTVRIERTAAAIRVSVADSGRGIAPEHIPRLFERFYRVDRGRSRAVGGTGLGLSIVKHAIALHGGRAGVESRVGEGSVFWFEIPPDGPHLHS